MSEEQINPDRADADLTSDGEEGTAAGNPIEGVEMSPEEQAKAVEPDDDALEVDGPQAGHA